MKQTIICLVGGSGVGKTYAANKLQALFTKHGHSCNVICSCTTRAMRDDEIDGEDHLFKTIADYNEAKASGNILADTVYGGEVYWTTFDQLTSNICIYVIDEPGILRLRQVLTSNIKLLTVHVIASNDVLASRNISAERLARDPKLRLQYDLTCRNDQLSDVVRMYSTIKNRLQIEDAELDIAIEVDMHSAGARRYRLTIYNDVTASSYSTAPLSVKELQDLHETLGAYLASMPYEHTKVYAMSNCNTCKN